MQVTADFGTGWDLPPEAQLTLFGFVEALLLLAARQQQAIDETWPTTICSSCALAHQHPCNLRLSQVAVFAPQAQGGRLASGVDQLLDRIVSTS